MKNSMLFMGILFLGILLFGCTGQSTTAQVSHGITYTTGVGTGAQNIAALPAALEGQAYSAGITPSGGTAPYTCASVPAGSVIIGSIRLNADCTITGTAPILSSGTTHAAYPVRFTVTDANNIVAGPFDLALEVIREENQGQGQIVVGQQVNPNLPTLNLPSQLPNASLFKNYNQSFTIHGGILPYLSKACEWNDGNGKQPIGIYAYVENDALLILGTPQEVDVGKYNLSCCIFDSPSSNAYSCGNTSISVLNDEETWTGTFQTSRGACYNIDTKLYYGKLGGSWTATITVPVRLAELMSDSNNFDTDEIRNIMKTVWSGSESVTEQYENVNVYRHTMVNLAVGGSVSNVKARSTVYGGEQFAPLDLNTDDINLPLLPGGCQDYNFDGEPTTLERSISSLILIPKSINETIITGTIDLGGVEQGTFTLTKVK